MKKRAEVSMGRRFDSGSFLKVLMPKIAKKSKKSESKQRSMAPNLAGGNRTQR